VITFTRAPVVEVGERPTSSDMAAQAAAVNDRMLSGIGDWAWRVSYYLVNLWRQMRNPDASGYLFPSQLEYWDIYGAVDPEKTDLIFPTADAGDNEGANLACTGMALVKGSPVVTVEEEDRYNELPLLWNLQPPQTLEQYWELSKYQRGGIDADAGVTAWPAGDAAQAWMRISSHYWSPHGKSYGGYLPTPEQIQTTYTYTGTTTYCGDSDGITPDIGYGVINYRRKFTGLRTDVDIPSHSGTLSYDGDGYPVITYAGGCPCGSETHGDGHIQGIVKGGMSYIVYVSNSTDCADYSTDVFPLQDWIEGPYEGYGDLVHTGGDHLNRIVAAMASDFRGSTYQRIKDTFKIQSIAFDAQRFFTRQYALAPARGTLSPDQTAIDVQYPSCRITGAIQHESGTEARWVTGGTSYAIADGFVAAAVFVKAKELETAATVQVLDGATQLYSTSLTPDDDGNASALFWFSNAAQRSELKVRIGNQVRFSSADGEIRCEFAELEDRKPDHWDAAMILRLAAAGNGRQVDGRGIDVETSKAIGDNFMRYGCIVGSWPISSGPEVNRNPLYDVARRLTNKCLHILPRRNFVAYEVADGKSILYYKRYAYGLKNSRVDLLAGIAPPPDAIASGSLQPGETYIVKGTGSVQYGGGNYGDGATFTAGAAKTYTSDGTASVYVYDGIRSSALKNGWTNRWCSFVEPKHYDPSESSIYKPSAYSDYWAFSDRCHFKSNDFPAALVGFVSYNYTVTVDSATGATTKGNPRAQSALYAPEAPTGYRYVEGANHDTRYMVDGTRFRKSCRVYEPPVEVESAVVHDWDADIVKITFSGRFQTHEDAPSSWSATAPTWDLGGTKPSTVTDLEDELTGLNGYRTIDNALRSYHVHLNNGHWQCPLASLGDYGGYTAPTDVYGACYPTVFLVALQNEPYDDGNDTVQSWDTRMTVDEHQKLDLYLRAGCEGWMDEALSLQHVCENNPVGFSDYGTLYDYSWENLQYEANGTRWTGFIGDAARDDVPEGFGPMPNTNIYADTFNRHSRMLNLLTKARLPVPTKLQYQYDNYTADVNLTYTNGMLDNVTGPAPDTLFGSYGWLDGAKQVRRSIESNYSPDGIHCEEDRVMHRIYWDTAWEYCLPDGVKELMENNFGGFIARVSRTTYTERKGSKRAPGSEEYCDNSSGFTSVWTDDGGTSFWCWDAIATETVTCETVPCGTWLRANPPLPFDARIASGPRINAASNEITYTPLLTDQFWVEVPLV